MHDYVSARSFTRAVIARALAGVETAGFATNHAEALRIANDRWGKSSSAGLVLKGLNALHSIREKAAVAGGGTDSGEWGAELADLKTAATAFLDAAEKFSAFARLPYVRKVPPNVPIVGVSAGATAYWTGQSKAIAVSKLALLRTTLGALKPSALVVVSRELMEDGSPEAEAMIERDLMRAAGLLVDMAAFDSSNAGVVRQTPAALNYGALSLASSGDIAEDVESALQAFSGDLASAAWIMNPRTAAEIGIRSGGKGLGADLGVRGGVLAGLPALTTEAITIDSDGVGMLTLIDSSAVVTVDEGLEVTRSDEALIEQDGAPQGAGDTPTAASATLMSLWQEELIGLKLVRRVNWTLGRQQAVVNVTGASYQGS